MKSPSIGDLLLAQSQMGAASQAHAAGPLNLQAQLAGAGQAVGLAMGALGQQNANAAQRQMMDAATYGLGINRIPPLDFYRGYALDAFQAPTVTEQMQNDVDKWLEGWDK